METPTIGATDFLANTRSPTTRGFADLRSEDFFALLIEELRSQNPLEPTDNQQLLAQLSSIRQMEQSTTLNDTLKALASEQRFGATASLIGHYVSGTVTNEAGDVFEIRGIVTGIKFNSQGQAVLELHNGSILPAENVDLVTLIENLPPEILEELQDELGGPLPGDGADGGGDGDTTPVGDGGDGQDGDGSSGDGDGSGGSDGAGSGGAAENPLARLIGGGAHRKPLTAARVLGDFGKRLDTAGAVLQSLFAPTLHVGI